MCGGRGGRPFLLGLHISCSTGRGLKEEGDLTNTESRNSLSRGAGAALAATPLLLKEKPHSYYEIIHAPSHALRWMLSTSISNTSPPFGGIPQAGKPAITR